MSKLNPITARRLVKQGDLYGIYRAELLGFSIPVAAAGAAIGFGSIAIADFPVKQTFIRGITASISWIKQDANIIATWSGAWALGSVPNANTVLTDATDFDIFGASGGTLIGPAVAGKIAAPTVPDRKTTELVKLWAANEEVNLNLIVNAADITDGTTGVVKAYGYVDFLVGQM